MGAITRKTSAPTIPLQVELPAVKQKTLCEKIWGIFCCCCRKQRVEEMDRPRAKTEIGFFYVEDHLIMPSSPTSRTRQGTHLLNERECAQVTKILMKPDIPQLTEVQRAAAMHLLKNMREEDPYLDPDRFLEIEGFPNDLVQEMHAVVSLPSPSATYISITSEGGSSPTTPNTPWRGFPLSSSEDSLGAQFDQTSKDLTPLQLAD